MLRKLIILGVCAGTSAAVPILFQARPDVVTDLARRAFAKPETQARTEASAEPEASAAPKPIAAPALSGRAVAIPADASGHFRAEFKINGTRVTGMVDTGATLVALNQSTARRLGLKLKESDFRHEVRTANGATRAAVAVLDSLAIGRIRVEKVEAVVLEDGALDGTLVGMSFLKRLDAYRVEDNTLLLSQ